MAEKYPWEDIKLSIPRNKPSILEIFLNFAGAEVFLGEYQLHQEMGPIKEENVIVEIVPGNTTMVTRTYMVEPGDALWKIAQKYNTDVEILASLNKLEDPGRIQVGQILDIPLKNANEGAVASAPQSGEVPLSQLDTLTNPGNNQLPEQIEVPKPGTIFLSEGAYWIVGDDHKHYYLVEAAAATPGAIIFEAGRYVQIDANGMPYLIGTPQAGTIFWSRGKYWRLGDNGKHYDVTTTETTEGQYVTAEQLKQLGFSNVDEDMVKKLNKTLKKYSINTPENIRYFLAVCMHESRLSLTEAGWCSRDYVKKCCEMYEPGTERGKDLGNTEVGDGFLFRGAGYIQMTGRRNYQFADSFSDGNIKQKIMTKGADYIAENLAWEAAGFWWNDNGMNKIVADGATLKQVSNAVNRGPERRNSKANPNGWEDRQVRYKLTYEIIK